MSDSAVVTTTHHPLDATIAQNPAGTRATETFAGLASLSYLPATAAPIGLTGEGLPVVLPIIGPEGEDPTMIEFARLLAAEIGGFVPPPAYT